MLRRRVRRSVPAVVLLYPLEGPPHMSRWLLVPTAAPEQQHPQQVRGKTGPKRNTSLRNTSLRNTSRIIAPHTLPRSYPQALEKDLAGVQRRITTMEKEAGGDAAELEAQLQAITKQVGGPGRVHQVFTMLH